MTYSCFSPPASRTRQSGRLDKSSTISAFREGIAKYFLRRTPTEPVRLHSTAVDRGRAPGVMSPAWGSDLPMRRQLKNRARFYSRAHHVVIKQHLFGKALASDRRAARPGPFGCARQRGLRRRPSLHPRRRPPTLRNGVVMGAAIRRAPSRCDLQTWSGAKRGRCGLAASRRFILRRDSSRRPRRLGGSGPAARLRKQTAAA
jgi:hypothetical protein